MEPLYALYFKKELARLGILRRLDVDFDRIDKEQEMNPPPHLRVRPTHTWSLRTRTAAAPGSHAPPFSMANTDANGVTFHLLPLRNPF